MKRIIEEHIEEIFVAITILIIAAGILIVAIMIKNTKIEFKEETNYLKEEKINIRYQTYPNGRGGISLIPIITIKEE